MYLRSGSCCQPLALCMSGRHLSLTLLCQRLSSVLSITHSVSASSCQSLTQSQLHLVHHSLRLNSIWSITNGVWTELCLFHHSLTRSSFWVIIDSGSVSFAPSFTETQLCLAHHSLMLSSFWFITQSDPPSFVPSLSEKLSSFLSITSLDSAPSVHH